MYCLVYRAAPAGPGADEPWSAVNLKQRNLLHLRDEAGVELLYAGARAGQALGTAALSEGRTAAQCLRGLEALPRLLDLRDFWGRVERVEAPAAAFDRPLIVLGAPRSGSTLLFELLGASPQLWTVGGESIPVIDAIPSLHPENRGFDSHALGEQDADPRTVERLLGYWLSGLVDRDGAPYLHRPPASRPPRVRFLEKTPRNSLRVPFLRRVFPDARFVFLYRDPRENIGSIMEVWETPTENSPFKHFDTLPGWTGKSWKLLLPPGWRALNGRPVAEIAALQWDAANRGVLDGVGDLGPDRVLALTYAELIAEPERMLRRIAAFAEVDFEEKMAAAARRMAPSRFTLSPARKDKWRDREAAIEAVVPSILPTARRFEAFVAGRR